jgi:hypothetical protein
VPGIWVPLKVPERLESDVISPRFFSTASEPPVVLMSQKLLTTVGLKSTILLLPIVAAIKVLGMNAKVSRAA